jgi:RND family efflux transporter MFP subunit
MMNKVRIHVAASSLKLSLTQFSVIAMALLLVACSEKPPVVEDIRPVRAIQIAPAGAENVVELAGEIQPRYESRLGFRVGGKVIARQVEIGSVVKRGQLLMQIDPRDLQLSQSQANASVNAAASNLSLAKAEYERYRELRQKNFVSQAVLDAKEAAYKSALANHEQSNAALNIATNQNSYANLVADADGVVTALQAEAGQVVAAGTPVVQLARTGEKEARISIPEDQVEMVRQVKAKSSESTPAPTPVVEKVAVPVQEVKVKATKKPKVETAAAVSTNETTLPEPVTCSFCVGLVVPIPTLPPLVIYNLLPTPPV